MALRITSYTSDRRKPKRDEYQDDLKNVQKNYKINLEKITEYNGSPIIMVYTIRKDDTKFYWIGFRQIYTYDIRSNTIRRSNGFGRGEHSFGFELTFIAYMHVKQYVGKNPQRLYVHTTTYVALFYYVCTTTYANARARSCVV